MSTPKVFVLEDDVGVCRILNRMLSLEEYEVRTSQSVEEAVTAIEGKSFDAYLLDYAAGWHRPRRLYRAKELNWAGASRWS